MDPKFKWQTPSHHPSLAAELGGDYKTSLDAFIMTLPRIDDDDRIEESKTERGSSEWYDIPIDSNEGM